MILTWIQESGFFPDSVLYRAVQEESRIFIRSTREEGQGNRDESVFL